MFIHSFIPNFIRIGRKTQNLKIVTIVNCQDSQDTHRPTDPSKKNARDCHAGHVYRLDLLGPLTDGERQRVATKLLHQKVFR